MKLTNTFYGGSTLIYDYNNYDKVGNRKSMKIGDANTQVYDYDKLYQLTSVDYNDGNQTGYSYDKRGNRTLTSNGSQTTYQSNRLNQYSKVNTTNYTYDVNGNLTNDGTYKYYYDVENRLTEVNNTSNQRVATYKYDFTGKRAAEIVGSSTTKHCYDGDQVIADYNSAGVLQKEYVFGPGIDEPICMLDVNNAMYYYHYDGLGSVVALSSNTTVRYTAIAAGYQYSLAIKNDGSIIGWGNNDYGQASSPGGTGYIQISAGRDTSIAVRNNGSLIFWGHNYSSMPPAGFAAVAVGDGNMIALKTDGTLYRWGPPSDPLPPGNDFNAIAAGAYHALFLKKDGSIVGWGNNDYGQATPPGGAYIGISAGLDYSMALGSDGSVIAWGSSNFSAPPNPKFVAVAAGYHIADALRTSGDICQWISPYYSPPPGNDYVAVAAGGDHALALKNDGSIFGWGDNTYGQAASKSAIKSTIVERYSYDVFGKPTVKDPNGVVLTKSAYGNRYMFTGREYDAETGNYYYRARYYSPKLGRFLQTDPIGYEGGLNIYAYCSNNSLNWIDPQGLWPTPIHNDIIDAAYPNLSKECLDAIKRGSRDADRHQDPAESFMHAMRDGTTKPPQTVEDARRRMQDYIREHMDNFHLLLYIANHSSGDLRHQALIEAYYELGLASHPVMDSTAPPHSGFQPWNGLGHPIQAIQHDNAESSYNPNQMSNTVNLMHNYYNP